MRHATDPDHVVAVSTIVSREKSIARSGWVGILWGVGHTLTILIVGAAIILFGIVIPPRLGLALEFSVALMLMLLGALNLSGAMIWMSEKLSPTRPERHGSHSHLHQGGIHIHQHTHAGYGDHAHAAKLAEHDHHPHQVGVSEHHRNELDPPHWFGTPVAKLGWFHALRPLLVGIVHGLAGSAAVALLVLGTIRNPRWAIFYLLVFGVGTIVGMMLMTLAFSVPFTVAGKRLAWLNRSL